MNRHLTEALGEVVKRHLSAGNAIPNYGWVVAIDVDPELERLVGEVDASGFYVEGLDEPDEGHQARWLEACEQAGRRAAYYCFVPSP